ncbi:glycoside hydrolase family 15 protein [Kribbella sp. NPDC059898]|uniref:glycoside hydrolase family 15 protein n=1 Tax=Kribbella sp. NPDC059898 TaxID=3346995 RepID=UPI00365249C7
MASSTGTRARNISTACRRGRGTFLPCTLWLADAYVLSGRRDKAREIFERVTGVANDLGLLSEEYDVGNHRLIGNFPQALTHLGVVNTALDLESDRGSSQRRSGRSRER